MQSLYINAKHIPGDKEVCIQVNDPCYKYYKQVAVISNSLLKAKKCVLFVLTCQCWVSKGLDGDSGGGGGGGRQGSGWLAGWLSGWLSGFTYTEQQSRVVEQDTLCTKHLHVWQTILSLSHGTSTEWRSSMINNFSIHSLLAVKQTNDELGQWTISQNIFTVHCKTNENINTVFFLQHLTIIEWRVRLLSVNFSQHKSAAHEATNHGPAWQQHSLPEKH